jgi:enoyl reductase-like protein
MATKTKSKASTKAKQTRLNLKMREVLARSYAFVRSREYTETVANITYEELLDKAIDRIEGTKGRSDVRSTRMDRVQKIKNEIESAVDTVKKLPPSYWALDSDDRIDPKDAQNTEE